jgi:pyridoxine kinase
MGEFFMNNIVPRVAAIHDISCVGRCSLTVILPVMSTMGVQVCPLPTAVFSTHLGGFKNMAYYDFSTHMVDFFRHWQREGITFDCIYSGFLASEQQIEVVSEFIDQFSHNDPLVLVDPVMGDEGRLYSIFTPDMQERMKGLVGKADVITPNYTEACFLLGEPYRDTIEDISALKNWLMRLADLGPSRVVITGIPANTKFVTMGYDRHNGTFQEVIAEHIPVRYPGTGDIFASVLAGDLLTGGSMAGAVRRAAEFVTFCVKATYMTHSPAREGVLLEAALPRLSREFQMNSKKEALFYEKT